MKARGRSWRTSRRSSSAEAGLERSAGAGPTDRSPPGRRILGALLVSSAYLTVAVLGIAGFKELIAGLFLIAVALGLREIERSDDGRGAIVIVIAVITAGMIAAYSYPGVIWIGLTIGVWIVAELIRARIDDPPSLRELCELLGVPERTLHHAFQEGFGMAPKAYLRALRLNAAHNRLRNGKGSVTEIAADLGLFHFGRFATEYRAMFGEPRSETLRCARGLMRPRADEA